MSQRPLLDAQHISPAAAERMAREAHGLLASGGVVPSMAHRRCSPNST